MKDAWVVVANSSDARLFRLDRRELVLVEEHLHPDSRRKDQEITSDHDAHREYGADRRGENTKVYGSYPEPTDPQEYEFDRFARELAHTLDHHRATNAFDKLVIVAPPHFHGLLNKHLPEPLAKCVVRHIDKDYTKLDLRALQGQLGPQLE